MKIITDLSATGTLSQPILALARLSDYSDGVPLAGEPVEQGVNHFIYAGDPAPFPSPPNPVPPNVSQVRFYYGDGAAPDPATVATYVGNTGQAEYVRTDSFAGGSQGFDFQGSSGTPLPWVPPNAPKLDPGDGGGPIGTGGNGDHWVAAQVDLISPAVTIILIEPITISGGGSPGAGIAIYQPPGTTRASRNSAGRPSSANRAMTGNLAPPCNFYYTETHNTCTGPPSNMYNDAAIPMGRYARYQADRFLSGLSIDSNVLGDIELWSQMDAVKSIHGNCTHNQNFPCNQNGRISTAVASQQGIFWAARDLGFIPSGAVAWRNRCQTLLSNPGFRTDHNFRAGTIATMAAANAAMNNPGDKEIAFVKTQLDNYIISSFPQTGVNIEEDNHNSNRTIHYQLVDGAHIAIVQGYLRNQGLDISAAAQTKMQNHMTFHWPNFNAILNGASLPYAWSNVNGPRPPDPGPVIGDKYGQVMEWAVTLGWHAGPVHPSVVGATSPTETFGRQPI